MRRPFLIISTFAAFCLLFGQAEAQPGGGRGGQGRGGGGRITAESIIGIAALNPDLKTSDEQLLKLRDALKDTYAKERKLTETLRGGEGNFQDVREGMLALRTELMTKVTEVFSEEQVETLKKIVQQRGRRPGGRGGRNWGGDGGGGGGRNWGGGGGDRSDT